MLFRSAPAQHVLRLEHLVHRAVPLPQQNFCHFDLLWREPAELLVRIPYQHLGQRDVHEIAGPASKVLVGEEQHVVIEQQLAGSEHVDAADRKLAIERAARIDEEARQRGMGVIGMKVMAYGQVPAADRPLHLRYAMSQSDVAIVGMDTVEHVEDHVRVAESYAPLDADEERAVMARTLALVPSAKKELWWLPEQRVAS